jgi:solute carrier family 10 (sodium/bile acid cotransporter), member 7
VTRLIPDRFVLMLLGVLALGWVLPVGGSTLAFAQDIIFIGIFLLFFLHGLRLPRAEVAKAAKNWRVQGAMLGFSFGVMPLAGWVLAHAAAPFLPSPLIAGILYLAALPSTVQSAISYASLGGGNVATSVVGAALSNLAGIVLTPALVALLVGAVAGVDMGSGVVLKIATMLLLPFALGQAAQHWLGGWAQGQKALLSLFDRGVILLAVYIAFAGAVSSGALLALDGKVLAVLLAVLLFLLTFVFGAAWGLGALLGFARADRVSLLFAGAHKSIATGAPMAAILFGADAGLVILPAILYHMAQLLASALIAARLKNAEYGRR